MITRFRSLDRDWSDFRWLFDQMDRRMRALSNFEEFFPFRQEELRSSSTSAIELYDQGEAFLARFVLPGFSEEQLKVEAHAEHLVVSGKREEDAPEGYRVHRRERGAGEFSQSLRFPCRIDTEKVKATYQDGVLEVRLHKAPEAQPKQISVKVS